jgi:uncharacterized SAM-binding protein YcdF (DUF218 family)
MPALHSADAIIVLGRGVNPDGTLPLVAQTRVPRALELLSRGVAPRMILSGRCSLMTLEPPPISEAAAMAKFARDRGAPEDALLIEDRSRDTIGNAYFTARQYLEPYGWTTIRVVTSDFHVPRTSWIFRKVLGDSYDVAFTPASSELFASTIAHRAREESDIARFLMEWIGPFPDGDRAAFDRFIERDHPGYSTIPTVTRELIQSRIAEISARHRDAERAGRGHRAEQERVAEL